MNQDTKDPGRSILGGKREISFLKVLVEILEHQPAVRQKEIGNKLGLTPQAISKYICEMVDRGFVTGSGRGYYEVTPSGIEWLLESTEYLASYSRHIRHDLIHSVSIWTAIAADEMKAGEEVGMFMQDGFLYAAKKPSAATGVVVADAGPGTDVGVTHMHGIVEHHLGIVHACKVPRIRDGGSRNVNMDQLKQICYGKPIVAAVGIEAYVALKFSGRNPDLFFGSREGVIEAALHGISCTIVIVDGEFTDFIKSMEDRRITYIIHDLIVP